jgi:transmembrane sensor
MSEVIADAAAEWVIRLASGPLSASEQVQLDAWVAADPRHQGALLRAQAGWRDLDRLAALHGPQGVQHITADPAERATRRRFGTWPRWSLAAGLVLAVGLGATLWLAHHSTEVLATRVGEIRKIELADHSVITLNTDSRIAVAFDPHRRNITLQKGEATFEVAHDASRPFLVSARGIVVKAVGTVFDVRLRDDRVDVTVTEGVVELNGGGTGNNAGPRLAKNTVGHVPSGAGLAEMATSQSAERQLAWHGGLLVFEGESLSQAAAEFSRYSQRKIIVSDASLAARSIFGVFRTDNVSGFVRAACNTFNARAVEDEQTIRLAPVSP